jgi:ribokinase
MPETRIDVFGLGQCSLDYIGKIDAYPLPDTKGEISDMVIQGGGPVATALVALARWGRSCYFSGLIGDDPFGRQIEASLRVEGVHTKGLVVRRGTSSQFAFIAAEPDTARRTVFWRRPTAEPIRPAEVDIDMIGRARVMHTDGLFIEAALYAAHAAKKIGIPVVVDAGTLREGMLDLAGLADFFIVSETFSRALTGADDPHGACRQLIDLGPSAVCVTLGAKGYVAMYRGRSFEKPAYPVKAVDTTGCGDIFHAGFIYGLLKNWDITKCLDIGAWAASRVSMQMGGRSGIPSLSDLKAGGYR